MKTAKKTIGRVIFHSPSGLAGEETDRDWVGSMLSERSPGKFEIEGINYIAPIALQSLLQKFKINSIEGVLEVIEKGKGIPGIVDYINDPKLTAMAKLQMISRQDYEIGGLILVIGGNTFKQYRNKGYLFVKNSEGIRCRQLTDLGSKELYTGTTIKEVEDKIRVETLKIWK